MKKQIFTIIAVLYTAIAFGQIWTTYNNSGIHAVLDPSATISTVGVGAFGAAGVAPVVTDMSSVTF